MPFVHLRIATATAPDQAARLRQGITRLMADVLRKQPDLTAVLVEPMAARASWGIGGAAVEVAAHLDATVTQGTNTVEEKAAFIRQAHALLRELLGEGLPLATYVVVTEVPGTDWGYAGQTQAWRAMSRGAG